MNNLYIRALSQAIEVLDSEKFDQILSAVKQCQNLGSNVYIIGNGGSASLAEHFATDWCKGVSEKSAKKCKAISLVSNNSLITALSNDFSYEQIFAKQLMYLANEKDLLFSISGSGNSKNILQAVKQAKKLGMVTVGISGFGGGFLANEVDHALVVDSSDMQIVEDVFSAIGHAIFKELSGTSVNLGKSK
jgi:D-sedoheptulose 7-phosphate isomerase